MGDQWSLIRCVRFAAGEEEQSAKGEENAAIALCGIGLLDAGEEQLLKTLLLFDAFKRLQKWAQARAAGIEGDHEAAGCAGREGGRGIEDDCEIAGVDTGDLHVLTACGERQGGAQQSDVG